MKTAVWILTLVGTAPVLLLSTGLLLVHIVAAAIGPRHGHHDFIVSVVRGDSAPVMSTHVWPLLAIIAGGGFLLLGVWRLLQH
jgi:hypothetical protein